MRERLVIGDGEEDVRTFGRGGMQARVSGAQDEGRKNQPEGRAETHGTNGIRVAEGFARPTGPPGATERTDLFKARFTVGAKPFSS